MAVLEIRNNKHRAVNYELSLFVITLIHFVKPTVVFLFHLSNCHCSDCILQKCGLCPLNRCVYCHFL